MGYMFQCKRKLTFNVVVDRTCAFILSEVTLMRPFLSLGSDKRLLEVKGPLVLLPNILKHYPMTLTL